MRRAVNVLVLFVPLVLAVRAAAQPLPVVTVARPLVRATTDRDFAAVLDPAEQVEVRAPLSGTAAEVRCRPGDEVAAGAPLVVLDGRPLRQQLDQAETAVRQAEAAWEEATANLEKAGRQTPPPSPGHLARLAALREAAGVRRDLARAAVARIEGDRAQLTVTAPVRGRVVTVPVAAGDPAVAGVGAATLLATIARTDRVRVIFDMDESTVLQLRQEQRQGRPLAQIPVHLSQSADDGFPTEGRLDYLAPRADFDRRRTTAHAVFANADGRLDAVLAPAAGPRDLRVRVTLGEPRPVVLVPNFAVGADARGSEFVLVVGPGNRVETRTVRTGPMYRGYRIIADGVQDTDRVIIGVGRPAADPAATPTTRAGDLRKLHAPPGAVVEPLLTNLPAPANGPRPTP